MKQYCEIITVEYEYESEQEREQHKKTMIEDGWEFKGEFDVRDDDDSEWFPAASFCKEINIQ